MFELGLLIILMAILIWLAFSLFAWQFFLYRLLMMSAQLVDGSNSIMERVECIFIRPIAFRTVMTKSFCGDIMLISPTMPIHNKSDDLLLPHSCDFPQPPMTLRRARANQVPELYQNRDM